MHDNTKQINNHYTCENQFDSRNDKNFIGHEVLKDYDNSGMLKTTISSYRFVCTCEKHSLF